MVQFGTVDATRARTCWGLDLCDRDPHSAVDGWLEQNPDAYVFARGHLAPAERADLLDHCRHGLAATVSEALASGRNPVLRQRIDHRLTAMSLDEALCLGARFRGDWFAPVGILERLRSWRHPRRPVDLDAIEILDRAVRDLTDGRSVDPDPHDLTRMAFHAAFNPVVVSPSAFAFAEMLTVSAWLGFLHRGRGVVMPSFIATYWLMLLEASDDPAASWTPDTFLMERAEACIGLDALRDISRRVLTTGPAVVRPNAKRLQARPVPATTVARELEPSVSTP